MYAHVFLTYLMCWSNIYKGIITEKNMTVNDMKLCLLKRGACNHEYLKVNSDVFF